MRSLIILACSLAAAAVVASSAGGAGAVAGNLSVAEGKGVVWLDLRGSLLGRLGNGTLRVTDLTPRDRFGEVVFGRELDAEEQVGPNTYVYRGQGIRFRMLGGAYRVVVRGRGIDLAAVGRGTVMLDGEPKATGDPAGLYSITGVDCGVDAQLCTALPDEPIRLTIGQP